MVVKGKKNPASTTSNSISQNNNRTSLNTAINSLNNNNSMLSAEEQRRVLEEEAKTLESFKKTHLTKQTSQTSPINEIPFTVANGNQSETSKPATNQDDLFGLDISNGNNTHQTLSPNNSTQVCNNEGSINDDLLMLSGANPFIQNMVNQQNYTTQPANGHIINPFQSNNVIGQPQTTQINVFNQQSTASFGESSKTNNQSKLDDLFSGLTFPSSSTNATPLQPSGEFDAFGDILQPTNSNLKQTLGNKSVTNSDITQIGDQKILSTDLESSLASLADNLDINRKNNIQKNHQWNSAFQQNQVKTGGHNWNNKSVMTTTPALNSPISNNWNNAPVGGSAFNPFAAAIQPQNSSVPIQQPASATQSSNPFDLF